MGKRKLNPVDWLILKIVGLVIIVFVILLLFLSYYNAIDTSAPKVSDIITAASTFTSLVVGIVVVKFSVQNIDITREALNITKEELKHTKHVQEAGHFTNMMEKYADKKMANSLRILSRFKEENKSDLQKGVSEWFKQKESGDKKALKIEDARRTVKFYYRTVLQNYQEKYTEKPLTLKLISAGGSDLFNDVVLPMESVANKLQYDEEFDHWPHLYGTILETRKKKKRTASSK